MATASAFLFVFVVCSIVTYLVYLRWLHPLASVPGPILASISRAWLVKHTRAGDMPFTMIALHNKYGPLVRTGPNEVSISDLAAIRTIYRAGSGFRKSDWYSIWQGHRKFDLFGERDESVHAMHRRLVSGVYSKDSVQDLESYIDEALSVLIRRMEAMQGSVLDMKVWAQLFAFDVIGYITFSKPFGLMEAGHDDGSLKQILKAHESGAWIGQVPALYWLHDWCMPVFGNFLQVNKRHSTLRDIAVREVSSRKKQSTGQERDIVSKLFEVQSEKQDMDETAVTSMVTSNIFAGSDTTAITIRSVIYYVLRDPNCKEAMMREVDSLQNTGIVSYAEAENMPYLQAVIHEALRLHPPIGLNLTRVTPTGGLMVGDKLIPPGCVVGANAWVVNRDRSVYGDDAEQFRPDRWLADDSEMKRYFLSFGGGSRVCLGRNISWMEVSKLIPTLFRHFDLELVEPDREPSVICWWIAVQDRLDIRLTRRTPKN